MTETFRRFLLPKLQRMVNKFFFQKVVLEIIIGMPESWYCFRLSPLRGREIPSILYPPFPNRVFIGSPTPLQ